MSPKISGNVVVKSKLPPRSGSVALRQLNPIYKVFFITIKRLVTHT